ncbi:MAG TPA: phage integrase N-terminal SAM-like domain-containing protein [Candidatus Tectomicrobia bacterium]
MGGYQEFFPVSEPLPGVYATFIRPVSRRPLSGWREAGRLVSPLVGVQGTAVGARRPQEPRPTKPLDQMRNVLRTPHDAIRTEPASVDWARRFMRLQHKRPPAEMGRGAIDAFLPSLAVARPVAAATPNQALSALLLLSKAVLRQEGGRGLRSARTPKRLPTVLSKPDALRGLHALVGVPQGMAQRLYGSGGRGLEWGRGRGKAVDCAPPLLLGRAGNGAKERRTLVPASLVAP